SNVALDRVRRRSPVASFDQDSGLMRALPPESGARPPARAEVDEERDRLIAAIERLPETYQVPVVLRHVEGLPYRDIAKRLGIREDALRKRIHRANEMLRNELSRRAGGARSDRKDSDGG
ncbi:MAG: RNA polymerase sigma factor, partial [Planctomycetota bacterium]